MLWISWDSLRSRQSRPEVEQTVLILVLVEHTLGERLLQRTLFQSITLVNSEYLSVFNRKNVPLTLQRYEFFGETRALKQENIIILRPYNGTRLWHSACLSSAIYAPCTLPLGSPLRFSASRAWQSALIKQFVTEAGAEVFLYRGFELIAFFESVSAYLRYWGGDLHCGKAVAPIERAFTYTGHTGRDCHGQTPADIYISSPKSLSCQPKGIEIFPVAPGAKNLCRLAKYPRKLGKEGEEEGEKERSTAWWQTMLLCLL